MPEDTSASKRSDIHYEVSGPNTVKIIIHEDGTQKSVNTRVFSQDQAKQLDEINRKVAESA